MTYFAAPDPAAFAPDRFPVWIWMDEPSFYGFPTYGEAGPEGRAGLRRPADRPRTTRTFERDEAAYARVRGVPGGATCRARSGRPSCTKTCLYTLTPDRDFVVDRLPEAPGVAVAPRRGPRVQVRLGPRADRGRAEPRRRDARRPASSRHFRIDRPILLESGPADLLDGLSPRDRGASE